MWSYYSFIPGLLIRTKSYSCIVREAEVTILVLCKTSGMSKNVSVKSWAERNFRVFCIMYRSTNLEKIDKSLHFMQNPCPCRTIRLKLPDAGLLARSQYPEGLATSHLDTGFSWFPCVYKRMLRWFPSFQVATTCLSCSPPDLNFLVTFLSIFVYM